MGNPVAARTFGDDYQAMVFWKYVNAMLKPDSEIEQIDYECNDIKSFDDVVIHYKKYPRFHGRYISTDYIQVKFHMRQSDFFTWGNLIDPQFINATTNSIMHNILNAYNSLGDKFKACRFIIYSPWDIKQDDALYNLVSNVDYGFETGIIFDGKTSKSNMGQLRKIFCDSLSIDENVLKDLLQQTCIYYGKEKIYDLKENLNKDFLYNNLKQCPNNKDTNPYIDIVRAWNKSGIHEFNKDYIIAQCEKEELIDYHQEKTIIAFRSFKRYTEGIEQRTEHMLDLIDYFDGRFLGDKYTWSDVFNRIDDFVQKNIVYGKEYCIDFEAHLSIAFAVGRILNTKSGIKSIPMQKTINGIYTWDFSGSDTSSYDTLHMKSEILTPTGKDIAIAISISNEIYNDVNGYIQNNLHSVNTIYYLKMSKIGNNSIVDGNHAWKLAEQINDIIEKDGLKKKHGTLHIFYSGPVAIMFNLGKLSLSYGKIQLYEYDFQHVRTETYYPSIIFPQEGEN